MDLAFNSSAAFTRWVVSAGLLQERFVVVDIGVQGGENIRWHLLGDYLVVHGFDAISEVIDALNKQRQPNRHYHLLAAGATDEEREFYFNAADPLSSSFYAQGDDRFQPDGSRIERRRQVKVRRLDSLLAEGVLPPADFLKVDVEGFEHEVFGGATRLLVTVLGVETETNFGVAPPFYLKSHFVTIHEMLLPHRLLVFDLNFNRIPRLSFQRELERKGLPPVTDQASVGKPATCNVLFCRDLIAEIDQPTHYLVPPANSFTTDALIKAMIIYELHALNDIALDTAVRFKDQLGTRFDVAKAMALLADPNCRGGSPAPAATTQLPPLRRLLRRLGRV